jgi:hypothetical protein
MAELFVYAAGLALIGAVAWAVASPLFRSPARAPALPVDSSMDRWRKQREESLAAIKDAEFDFALGKLSEPDYRSLRARLETEALEAIHRLEDKPDDPAR